MQAKPLIGINADFRAAQGNQPSFSVVTAGYYDSILRAGGVPVIIPPMEEEDDINAVLDSLDGFVFIGGADLDPRRDGFMLHPTVRPMDRRREAFGGAANGGHAAGVRRARDRWTERRAEAAAVDRVQRAHQRDGRARSALDALVGGALRATIALAMRMHTAE